MPEIKDHKVKSHEVPGGNTKPPGNHKTKENSMRGYRTKQFCFTYYPDMHDVLPNLEIPESSYVIMGKEICPKTNNIHYQSYIYWNKPITLKNCINRLKKHFNKPCHVEICKGSIEDNINYCSKDGNVYINGIKPRGQGARTDIYDAKDKILNGETTADDICLEDPEFYHKYGRTLNKIEDIALRKRYRTEMTKGIWIHGPTGVGKSHMAYEGFNPDSHYVFPNDNGWWDGYKGQETVIINEFRGNIQYSELLDLVDKWPKTVKRRGREPVPFLAKKLIITSSLKPGEVYHNLAANDNLNQLYRRFDIINLDKEDKLDKDIFIDDEN